MGFQANGVAEMRIYLQLLRTRAAQKGKASSLIKGAWAIQRFEEASTWNEWSERTCNCRYVFFVSFVPLCSLHDLTC